MTKTSLTLFASLWLVTSLYAQPKQTERLKVFVDCSTVWCDMTYLRTEINIVDFLLDRVAADVHLLVTNQSNGSGGLTYQIIFFGQNRFKNYKDSIQFTTDPNATEFERRERLVNYMKFGLAPLVAKTRQADKMSLAMKTESIMADSIPEQVGDSWSYWVFRLRANGSFGADQNYKESSLNYGVTANRTIDKLRTSFSINVGDNRAAYTFRDSLENEFIDKVYNSTLTIDHLLVRSINDHWSYAYNINIHNSTFINTKIRTYLAGAIEYDIFPYKEVNNKLLTISYGLDARQNVYYDSTIFGKVKEVLYGHSLKLSTAINQKWGYVNTGIAYHNYFHDWKLNNIGMQVDVDIRITGGLSFWTYMYGGIIHDQVYLPVEGASREDVLLRRKQLASSYSFRMYFGITYRFGSKLNNFVNPRFTGTANYLGF